MVKRKLIEQFADAQFVSPPNIIQETPQGCVIWITGLSGAGKTTVANTLKARFENQQKKTILLDGDDLREVFENSDSFDAEARIGLARSYGRLCQLLASQGHQVICATISMRNVVYDWNRRNLPNYLEVFLDIPLEIRQARDPKGYYAAVHNGALNNFAGNDQVVDLPPAPDIHIRNEQQMSAVAICDVIEDSLREKLSVER